MPATPTMPPGSTPRAARGPSSTRGAGGRHGERGTAVLEFAVFLPFLILALVGFVDICLLLSNQINLSHISREAASSMSRGASLAETAGVIVQAEGNLGLDGPGGRIILTEVFRPTGGAPVIVAQQSFGGLQQSSAVGTLPPGDDSAPAAIPNGAELPEGMTLSVVEVFSQQGLFGGPELTGTLATLTLSSLAAF